MKELILEAYALACCCALPTLFFFLRRSERGVTRADSACRTALFFVFLLYLCAVLTVTGSGTFFDLRRQSWSFSPCQLNLTFFSSPFLSEGYLLNILLFIPLGFLLVLLWPGRGRVLLTVLYGFGFSLAIECSQLLNSRITDLDDLTANTLGALAGALAAALLRLLLGRKRPVPAKSALAPALFLFAAFLGRFLFFDELRAAGWLYGF